MTMTASTPHRKSGQTLIFMAMVVVMIAFAALFYFDVHKTLHVKGISRNAGDAAALAGARWQAISLNVIGSLNVAQALAHMDSLSAGVPPGADSDAIAELQRRLAFSGPLFGFLTAQQAAKNNGIFNQEDFRRSLLAHIDIIENEYARFMPEPFAPTPPFLNGWLEYADMLSLLAEHGIAVNAAWNYFAGYSHQNHLLLTPAFYDAIAGRSWCWFYHNAYDELREYDSWRDWDSLPPIRRDPPINSEVFGLDTRRLRVVDNVPLLPPENTWSATMASLRAHVERVETDNPDLLTEYEANWSFYSGRWASWTQHIPADFPWDGGIRPEYDYGGADAAVQILAETRRHSGFRGGDQIQWSAGAKPFGTLEGPEGPVPASRYGLILPAFTDVRLTPIDATLSAAGGELRPGWLEFIMIYLPRYMEDGPSALPMGNWYANQLLTWEYRAFRETGVRWLLYNHPRCDQPGPGGPGSSGGTFHGH